MPAGDENSFDRANRLARELADALDDLAQLKKDYAEYVERTARRFATVSLSNGLDLDEAEVRLWDDADRIVQRVKDRAWNEGYLEGIHSTENKVREFRIEETHNITKDKDG